MSEEALTGTLSAPQKLQKSDVRDNFSSGAPELDEWLQKYAFQNQRSNNSVTYVSKIQDQVVAYYSIATAAVEKNSAPASLAKGRPREIPCVLLARFAVDSRLQGRGVGASLLQDVVRRVVGLADQLGVAALLIHCRDDNAKEFYTSNLGALESPADRLQLMVPIKGLGK